MLRDKYGRNWLARIGLMIDVLALCITAAYGQTDRLGMWFCVSTVAFTIAVMLEDPTSPNA